MDTNNQNPEPEKKAPSEETPPTAQEPDQKKEEVNSVAEGTTETEKTSDVKAEKSEPKGQRNVMADKVIISKILEKFPLFKGLTAFQYQQMLPLCAIKTFEKETVVCKESDESHEMYILLSGKLAVMFHKTTVLTTISPISLVGELAFFTGQQGFSSVVATANSTVISIRRDDLFHLLKRDCGLSYNILMNVISELAKKLRTNDEIIDQLKKK
jgi:hypothetical protein